MQGPPRTTLLQKKTEEDWDLKRLSFKGHDTILILRLVLYYSHPKFFFFLTQIINIIIYSQIFSLIQKKAKQLTAGNFLHFNLYLPEQNHSPVWSHIISATILGEDTIEKISCFSIWNLIYQPVCYKGQKEMNFMIVFY